MLRTVRRHPTLGGWRIRLRHPGTSNRSEPSGDDRLRCLRGEAIASEGVKEHLTAQRQQRDIRLGDHRRRTGDVTQKGDLAEVIAGLLAAGELAVLEHLDLAGVDDEEALAAL